MKLFSLLTRKISRAKSVPATPYEAIGGEESVKRLANRFYDIMESDPLANELLQLHSRPLNRIRHVFTQYLIMWMGGPDTYQQQYGHPRLRARHLPFAITPQLKAQWMYCMRKAMMGSIDDIALAEQLLKSLESLADHMVNTHGGQN